MNGREIRVPKYYDSQFELIDPDRLQKIKDSRKAKAERFAAHNTAAIWQYVSVYSIVV